MDKIGGSSTRAGWRRAPTTATATATATRSIELFLSPLQIGIHESSKDGVRDEK